MSERVQLKGERKFQEQYIVNEKGEKTAEYFEKPPKTARYAQKYIKNGREKGVNQNPRQ
jgi:hypothetical protein